MNTNGTRSKTKRSQFRWLRLVISVTTTLAMMLGFRNTAGVTRTSRIRSVATAFVTKTPIATRNSKISNNYLYPSNPKAGLFTAGNVRLRSSRYDDAGRRVRTPRKPANDDWGDDDDDWGAPASSSSRRGGRSRNDSWDDFDPWGEEPPRQQQPRQRQPPQRRRRENTYSNTDFYDDDDDDDWGAPRSRPSGRQQQRQPSYDYGFGDDNDNDWNGHRRSDRSGRDSRGERGRGRGGRGRGGRGRGGRGGRNSSQSDRGGRSTKGNPKKGGDTTSSRSINMNALEGAGFVHLYGISSVLNALTADRRDLETSLEKSDQRADDPRFDEFTESPGGGWDDDEDEFEATKREETVKPQAQFRPYLFVQERGRSSDRRGSKASAAQRIQNLAEQKGVPVATVDKGILNVLSGNRPHQGFALRCGKLFFEGLSRIPLPRNARGGEPTASPSLWLVLDEVVDPQNLGALLRSAYFLGGPKRNSSNIGVLVCSKNSAPPSPVVSASSAGALEVLDVHSTSNLPRTLQQARDDGFRIIGASASVPSSIGSSSGDTEEPPPLYDLQDLPVRDLEGDDRPILLVLGSEGHGLRTLVAKACTEFVRIPSGMDTGESVDDEGVDSLNVSVSAGIMLWHLLHG